MSLFSAPQNLSHVHGTPNEIWAEIFLLAVPALTSHETKLSRSDAPISVSQTCSRWREIATHAPRLWSSISFEANGRSKKMYPDLKIISLWLERSKSVPLFINLGISWISSPVPPGLYENLARLFSTISRWESAVLDLHKLDSTCISEILSWMPEEAPLLSSFSLALEPTNVANITNTFWTRSTQLRKLRLRHDSSMVTYKWGSSSNIPYEQLTSLHLGGQGAHEHMTPLEVVIWIFKHGKNIVTCIIEHVEKPDSAAHALRGPPFIMHHLRHLYLCLSMNGYDSGDTRNSLTDILDYLTAPSLEALTIVYAEPCWKQEPYSAFIQRSSCSLQQLHFLQTPMHSRDVLECLRLSPTLKRFHVKYFSDRRCFLDAEFGRQMALWNATTSQFEMCPELEWFSVDDFVIIRPAEILVLAKIMKTRLQPPDHSKGAFTTFSTGSRHNMTDQRYPVRRPRSKPINDLQAIGLDIVCNDGMLEPATLWETYHSS